MNLPRPTDALHQLSRWERMAVSIGIKDGQMARTRAGSLGVIAIFRRASRPLADRRLEALRAYAELAHSLFPRSIPATSLEGAGFSPAQIREMSRMIQELHSVAI